MFEREFEREYLSHTLPTVSVCGSDLGGDGGRPVRSLALSQSLSHTLPHTHTLSHTYTVSLANKVTFEKRSGVQFFVGPDSPYGVGEFGSSARKRWNIRVAPSTS